MGIIKDIENAEGIVTRDIRTELPNLMAALPGVNAADEHQVFHAAIVWLVSEMAKIVENPATVAEIAKVL